MRSGEHGAVVSEPFPFRTRLRPRHVIDIGWDDLAFAARAPRREGRELAAIFPWSDGRPAVACLSARSGFDALLQSIAAPAGSDVVLSAVNIEAMAEIARGHGLTVTPVDLSLQTLRPSAEAVARAMTPPLRWC